MFFDETFHSAGQVLNTLGLQDQGGLTQLGDHACQHEHADGFIAWSESFESGGQDRFQAFAQQALFEVALFLALWMRQALGHIQGDFFDSVVKHAPDLAHQMEDVAQVFQGQACPCQVFAIGDFQIRQEILRLIMGSDRLPQLVGNVFGLALDGVHAADQTIFADHHAQAVGPLAQFGKGLIVQQEVSHFLATILQALQNCLGALANLLGLLLDEAHRHSLAVDKSHQELRLAHCQTQLETAQPNHAFDLLPPATPGFHLPLSFYRNQFVTTLGTPPALNERLSLPHQPTHAQQPDPVDHLIRTVLPDALAPTPLACFGSLHFRLLSFHFLCPPRLWPRWVFLQNLAQGWLQFLVEPIIDHSHADSITTSNLVHIVQTQTFHHYLDFCLMRNYSIHWASLLWILFDTLSYRSLALFQISPTNFTTS